MKLDLDFIKEILTAIENYNDTEIDLQVLTQKLDINIMDEISDKLKSFIHHMRILYEIGSIDCPSENLGFHKSLDGNVTYSDVPYNITFNGHQLLDSMRNDTLWNKVKAKTGSVGIELLRQAPSLAMGLLMQANGA